MDRWIDRWIAGQIDGWRDRWIDRWIAGQIDGWRDRWIDEQRWMDG